MRFLLALSLAVLGPHLRADEAPAWGQDARLMRALEAIEHAKTPRAEGLAFGDGARRASQYVLSGAGVVLVAIYAADYLSRGVFSHPGVRHALVRGLRHSVTAGAAALGTGGVLWYGGQLYNAYMQDAYAQWAAGDERLYQTAKGLGYFFQLPIDEQFLYARRHVEFAEFLISLGEAQTRLDEGFARPESGAGRAAPPGSPE